MSGLNLDSLGAAWRSGRISRALGRGCAPSEEWVMAS